MNQILVSNIPDDLFGFIYKEAKRREMSKTQLIKFVLVDYMDTKIKSR